LSDRAIARSGRRASWSIRRERTRRTFAADLAKYLDSEWTLAHTIDELFGESTIASRSF
jgi:hypothetical protein